MIKGISVAGLLGESIMARKPASMYRRLKGPAYTRRKYIGGVPNNRIQSFHAGNRVAAETGQFKVIMELRADNSCQIRHTALEAARVISRHALCFWKECWNSSPCKAWSKSHFTANQP